MGMVLLRVSLLITEWVLEYESGNMALCRYLFGEIISYKQSRRRPTFEEEEDEEEDDDCYRDCTSTRKARPRCSGWVKVWNWRICRASKGVKIFSGTARAKMRVRNCGWVQKFSVRRPADSPAFWVVEKFTCA